MAKFIARRLALLPVVMLGVTLLLFLLLQLLTPEMRASLYVKDPRQLASLDAVIEKYNLRAPWYVQYGGWLKQIAKGDLGYSETAKMPVSQAVRAFFPATFELALTAFIPIMVIGVWLGVRSAVHKDKWLDHLSRFVAISGWSLPAFVLGLVLLMVFYGHFRIFPPGRLSLESELLVHSSDFTRYTGLMLLDAPLNGNLSVLLDSLRHLVLPAVTLVYIQIALLVRITRSSMLEELGKDYVRTARAKGVAEADVVNRHALRNALIPVITMASIQFVGLMRGVIITETIFNYPGIGRWGAASAIQLDIPGVMGFALLTSLLFVLGNLAADCMYAVADPRIRLR